MNKMRLIRDKKWFFQFYPYHQMYMDSELVKGWVSINYLTDGEEQFWNFLEKAGPVPVSGKGMIWLTIIPEDKSRCIGVYFLPNRKVSVWYIDVIEEIGIDDDGVIYYIDKYLDVILSSQGDVCIKDRDELDAAYASGELSTIQYENALREGELIVNELATHIDKTEKYCIEVLKKAEEMISNDHFTIFLDVDGVLDIYNQNIDMQELIPQAVQNLKGLVNRSNADVVIISDWRYGSPLFREKARVRGYDKCIANWDNLMAIFYKENIQIKDVTPWDDHIENRTSEIKIYLDKHPEIKRYVILDDCFGDNYESDADVLKHLVYIDAMKGLQQENLISACTIMNMLK
ncbi:MAG TPA: HAD domain-containing protein [Lachnospiraceae bacterium]|nr:HAD domain-containing protein [Lachnospiraceae bacterium]